MTKRTSRRLSRAGLSVIAALLLVVGLAPNAFAQSTPAGTEADPFVVPFHWGLKPGNREPGDKFRLMFQTENRRNGTSSTIGDYNSFVQGDAPPGGFHAEIAPYVSEFKAIVSTAAVDARDNIGATGTGVQINWVNGAKVADDYADFWDGSWRSRAPTLGNGVGAGGRAIFTGTDNDGTGYTDHQMGTSNPRFGQSRLGSPLSSGNTGNSGTRAFYAMSPVFQVDPALPPVSVEFAKNTQVGRHQYDYNIEEGATLKPRLTFDPPTRAEATLIIYATPGTATAGVDFPAGPYRVTVPVGATRHTFDIEIPWDAAIEDYETFTLTIGKLPDGFRYDPQNSAMVQIVNVSVVPSDWSLIPSDLGPGDKFRLLFKTAAERDATSSDIADYDEFVRTRTAAHPWHADIEDYGDTFRVVGSTGAVDGNFHTGSGNIVASQQYPGHTTAYRPVYWLDGVKIADDYRFFWRGWWGDANAPANQRHADGLAATNTRGPTTGTSYCCIRPSFGTEIHSSGIRTPDPYWLGGSRSTVVKGSGVASPDTGPDVNGHNSIQDEVNREYQRGQNAPYLALSAVFEVGDFLSTDPEVWIDDHRAPSYIVHEASGERDDSLIERKVEGDKVRVYEGETATFTLHVASAPTDELTVQVNVRDTQNYVAADDPDDDVVGEGIQKFVIPSGQTSFTFTVPTVRNNRDDPFGELIASILPGPGYRVPDGSDPNKRNVGIVEVVNFWGLGNLSLSEVPGTHETDLNIPFTSAAGSAYTVHYRIVDAESTATISDDYNIISGTSTFRVPAGSPSGKLRFSVIDDSLLEGTEYVVLEFTRPANLQPNKITIPIYDNEPPVKLKPYADGYAPEIDTTLTEGYAPESEHQIRVAGFDYQGRRMGLAREVHYEYCVEGTATLGDDYELIKPDDTKVASAGCHPVTLPATWERMKLVRVKVLDDGLHDEPDETVKIRLQQSTTAGMETDTGLATVPESIRIAGETTSVVVTIEDTLPSLEVAYVIKTTENVPGSNSRRDVRTDCQDAGNDRCRIQYRSSNPYIHFTIRTTSGLDLRNYVKAHWTVEDSGDVIVDSAESGSKWLQRSTKSYFDIPVWLRHDAGDGYAIFKLTASDNNKYRVKDGAGKVCVAVNDGTCPQSGAPPDKVPDAQAPDAQVANLQVSAVDDDTASATWDAVPRATGYQVEWTGEDGNGQEALAGFRSGVTGNSIDIRHQASEALTLTVTVTPEYVDGNGATQVLNGLASTATLDVGSARAGLTDSDPEVTVSASGAVTEGAPASFTVTATPAPAAPLSVTVTVGQTGDFGAATGQRTVTVPTSGSATLAIATVDDGADEPDGAVSVTVDAGDGYTVGGSNTATVAVADDDDPPTTIGTCVSDAQWSTVDGYYASNASKGPNYGRNWYRVLIAYRQERTDKSLPNWVGATTRPTTPYTVAEARTSEGTWSGWRPVRKALECLAGGTAPAVTVAAGGAVTEGAPASFTVTATPAPAAPLTVTVTVGQSGDFGAATGQRTVIVPTPGSVTLDIATIDDGTDEPDGSVSVTVDAGNGYTVGGANTATVAVADDDNAEPEVSIAASGAVTEGTSASFTVAATPAPAASLSVTVTVGQSGDFGAATGQRTVIVPPSGSMTLDIATVDDGTDEPDGAVSVTVDAGTGYAVATAPHNAASVTVRDDDPATTIGECVSDGQWNTVDGYYDANALKTPNYGANWYRVLIAYRQERTDKTLPSWLGANAAPTTPYTVDEARTSEGIWGGWRPVRKVLECLEAAAGKLAFVPLMPASGSPHEGLVQIVNPGTQPATVRILATDDAGWSPDPIMLNLGAGETVHLTSRDLEWGDAAKGLDVGVGAGTGDWRLEVVSDVGVRVLPFVRTDDGLLAPMGDIVEADEDAHRVPTFNPATGREASGLLRLVNRGSTLLAVTLHGIDDAGRSPGGAASLDIPARGAVTLAASELEGGAEGFRGALGDGAGLWQLRIAAEGDLAVMNLLEGPGWRLSNLSGDAAAMREAPGAHVVPWLPAAADAASGFGTLRIVNRSAEDGTVRIQPYDAAGRRYEMLTLPLVAGGASNLDAWDLELGNAAAGLPRGAGPGLGAWRLEVSSDLEVEVLAYVRRPTGAVEPLAGLEDRAERR